MTRRVNIFARKNGGIEGLAAVETWIAKSFDPKLLPCAGRSLRRGAASLLRGRTPDALSRSVRDQRLEPAVNRLPPAASGGPHQARGLSLTEKNER